MATEEQIYVFNTKQQALNSKKLAELFSFTSNDFAGLISNAQFPIVVDNTENNKTWSWASSLQDTQVSFMGGGVDIAYNVSKNIYTFNNECSVWGLEIGIPDPNATIAHDIFSNSKAKITEIKCSEIGKDNLYFIINFPSGNPSQKDYYEVGENGYMKSEDEEVDPSKVYYFRLENEVFVVKGAEFVATEQPKTFEYYGNTVWITDDSFFIPFCGLYNGEVIPMLFNRDKTGYESFLTARTYYNLLQEFGNKFVWRVGGPTLGDIGDLNITNNIITNKNNSEDGVIIDSPTFSNVDAPNNGNILADRVLFVDENGKVLKTTTNYVVPIRHGGTSGNNEDNARKNLGFSYGTSDPGNVPVREDRDTQGNEIVDIGAVYFKIL